MFSHTANHHYNGVGRIKTKKKQQKKKQKKKQQQKTKTLCGNKRQLTSHLALQYSNWTP